MTSTVVVDTSALVAVMTGEDDASWFAETLHDTTTAVVSSGSLQECVHVLTTRSMEAGDPPAVTASVPVRLLELLGVLGVAVVPVTEELAILGGTASAHLRRTPARLNFGDGFAYALARHLDCPIACKGNDFPLTDVDVTQP